FLGSQFSLELKGVELARFQAVSGLSWETEMVEFKDVTVTGKVTTRKRPGQTKYGDITLKRGLSADTALLDWYKGVLDGKVERKDGSIVVYDMTGTELDRWNFERAWPSKWSASDLDAGSDTVMIEELTIAIEHLERKK
ncbi:MAG: phage tail protein, partial [Ilumatobacteraceae bacterium]